MSVTSRGEDSSPKLKSMGNHEEFLNRITKSLYYAKLPATDCLSLPVTELAAELFSEARTEHSLERLHMEEASEISRNACVSPCSLVLALLYLERLKDCNPDYLQQVAPSELFLVSLMVASKFLNDDGEEDDVYNTEWAESGGLTVLEINQLEKEFLKAIDWSVFIHDKDFWNKLQDLEKSVAYKEARRRGWFSYTELNCLMNTAQLIALIQTVINASSICLVTYVAGVATLVISAIIGSHIPGSALSVKTYANKDSKTEIIPMHNMQNMVNVIDQDIINENLTNFEEACLKCKGSIMEYAAIEKNNTDNVSWKWWLNSMMTWLPQYSDLDDSNLPLDIINSKNLDKYYMDLNSFITENDESIMKSMMKQYWKAVLGINDKYAFRDWQY
ncbi:protein CNPPD1 [Prorops nasuta]|uniref:protein CNPPD1 n=1 Tax=Prorops nasuta TaxID=863751 RepID=UPI0034CF2798